MTVHLAADAAPHAARLMQLRGQQAPAVAAAAAAKAVQPLSAPSFAILGMKAGFADLVLPIVSSADNFVVGVALGIGGQPLPMLTVLIVAIANACGMLLACFVGRWAGAWAPMVASLVAGGFFVVIGGLELKSWWTKEEGPSDKLTDMAGTSNAFVLALPMTLNNLATGLAGGMMGGNIYMIAFLTFVASFSLMYLGYFVGRCTGKALPMDPRFAVGVVFFGLGLMQLMPVVAGQVYGV